MKNDSNSPNNSAVAIYNTHTDAQAAVDELQTAGIDMKLISVPTTMSSATTRRTTV